MEERKVNIKRGNVKPTRSVRARSSTSFDNSVNTKYGLGNILLLIYYFILKYIYKIVFICIIDSETRQIISFIINEKNFCDKYNYNS